jgi:hypothetical protein
MMRIDRVLVWVMVAYFAVALYNEVREARR